MKRWIGLTLLLVPFVASAAGFWDGNAALERGDAAFESGLYAASNSFPKDTRILIENLDTGKTTAATITERIEGRSDILVLLSPKTAEALGIEQGTLASVRVTVTSSPNPARAQPSEQAYSPDPDLNPAAGYPSDRTPPSVESLAATQAPAALAQAPLPTSTPESPAAEQKPTEQTTADQQTDEAIAAAAAARSPQKQLFLPPREDQKFVYHKPAETEPTQIAQTTPAETQPTITAVIGEPTARPAATPAGDVPLAEAAAPEESRAQEIVGAGAASPPTVGTVESAALLAPEPQGAEQTEVSSPAANPSTSPESPSLALAEPEAPSAAQAAVAPTVKAAAIARIAKADTYYLQLGAYASEKIAQDLAASLPSAYPTLVVAPAGAGTGMFRVLIGPLNRAESGTVLTRFRYRGFPDAFLKRE